MSKSYFENLSMFSLLKKGLFECLNLSEFECLQIKCQVTLIIFRVLNSNKTPLIIVNFDLKLRVKMDYIYSQTIVFKSISISSFTFSTHLKKFNRDSNLGLICF